MYKDNDWEMFPQIHQAVINTWNILIKFVKEEEIERYSNGLNPLSSKPQIKKIKEYHAKKRKASKEEPPVASTRNPQVNQLPQERKNNQKKNWKKLYSPSYRVPRIQKDAMDNFFNMAITLM
ncbi:hypothetical protein O181_059682 [Austropuccinia psidii MF-1]|uniref:Uncharacterized protein n=1 Tax=Austropuccinia psidii MF-1 TaxID=1389203 RepID=A0A9Q3EH53_9BASI|nr:hypothetical protein [Austropuccinia psidii MF-1]